MLLGAKALKISAVIHRLSTYPAQVLSSERLAEGQVLLRLDLSGTGFSDSHKRVGQYAFLGLPGEERPRPMAIASGPGSDAPEFLLKARGQEELEGWLALSQGAPLRLSAAEGAGFPLGAAHGRPLLLFAAGSAIAAIRPVVEAILKDRVRYGPVHLYYGVRTPGELAFQLDFPRWRAGGIEVTPVVSRPEGTGWTGATGYVQDHLPARLEDAEHTIAFVCGAPEMEEAVYGALAARGVDEERVFRNYG